MSSVMPSISEIELETRRRWGADRWDEVWDGVLHMAAAPNPFHQDIESDLERYLQRHWADPIKARVRHNNNLAKAGAGKRWKEDYRIPDLVLMTRDRFHIIKRTHLEGVPNVVVEIHSPDDEAYDKLPWYLDLGVPEVWIIDRDTLQPEIHLRKRGRWAPAKADSAGWLHSLETGVEMRRTRTGKLGIRMNGDPATMEELPSD
jgi:Uma2 family endonuclease